LEFFDLNRVMIAIELLGAITLVALCLKSLNLSLELNEAPSSDVRSFRLLL
jgi:hypothetical protein